MTENERVEGQKTLSYSDEDMRCTTHPIIVSNYKKEKMHSYLHFRLPKKNKTFLMNMSAL